MLALRIAAECGEFNWRRVLREMDARDLDVWAAFFRLQAKEQDKQQEGLEATEAKREAMRRLRQPGAMT